MEDKIKSKLSADLNDLAAAIEDAKQAAYRSNWDGAIGSLFPVERNIEQVIFYIRTLRDFGGPSNTQESPNVTLEDFLETEPAYTRFVLAAQKARTGAQPMGINFDASPAAEIKSAAIALRSEYGQATDAEIISDLKDELESN